MATKTKENAEATVAEGSANGAGSDEDAEGVTRERHRQTVRLAISMSVHESVEAGIPDLLSVAKSAAESWGKQHGLVLEFRDQVVRKGANKGKANPYALAFYIDTEESSKQRQSVGGGIPREQLALARTMLTNSEVTAKAEAAGVTPAELVAQALKSAFGITVSADELASAAS